VVGLSVALYQKPRFTETKGDNPYIMFDSKTAQTCWAGKSDDAWDKLAAQAEAPSTPAPATLPRDFFNHPTNPLHLPFCKDLK